MELPPEPAARALLSWGGIDSASLVPCCAAAPVALLTDLVGAGVFRVQRSRSTAGAARGRRGSPRPRARNREDRRRAAGGARGGRRQGSVLCSASTHRRRAQSQAKPWDEARQPDRQLSSQRVCSDAGRV
jgi:hypothetical protein